MKAYLKNAAITTATVLVAIYILRKLPVTNNLVSMALQG